MAQAVKDKNFVDTMIGVLNTDGETPTLIKADPDNNCIKVNDGTSGSDLGSDDAARDDNQVPILMAVSSSDGATPVPLYVNSDGEVLIKST